MKFELTYKNRFGSVARLDIITFADTTVTEVIEGTEQPFTLKYINEKGDKSGSFRTSGADINIYETENFNIDELKTSNETDIKVEYYIDEVLMWTGFIIPDFFSREIGVPAIVNMTASDRLNTLKGVTLPSMSDTVTLRYLAEQCLAMTGLSLPLNTYAGFTNVDNSDNIFDSKVTSQRVKDTKGRSISCYDVLQSILTLTNSILIQRNGEWYIINKTELETGTVVTGQAEVVFDEVSRGARRQIQPVASSVGVFNEHGGSRLYPYNYDFKQSLTGWTAVGGFAATTNDKKVSWYLESSEVYTPVYETASHDRYLVNTNELSGTKYLQSDFVRIPYAQGGEVEVNFDINATLPTIKYFGSKEAVVIRFAIVARKNSVLYFMNESGLFDVAAYLHEMTGAKSMIATATADTKAKNVKGKIISDNLNDYEVAVRIYGCGTYATTLIRSAVFGFKFNAEFPKGNIYKTEQGVNFTKQQDVDTSIFGDYITSGVNGYFYDYPIDDTASLLTSTGVLTTRWTTVADTDELPILQHVSRQKSRLFSVAHDLLRAQISIQKFDPLAIFKDCANKRYTLVSGSVDFLNSSVDVEIEEIKTDTLISKRDFIYSYFGDKEDGIKSVGGISSGSGGGVGGGMTSGQLEILTNLASWWKYDETNNAIYSPLSVYSEGEVSAYGVGAEGAPTEGVSYMKDLLDVQFATTVPTNDTIKFNGTKWVNVPFPTGVSSWNDLTDKPLTFTPTAHNHSASEITSGVFAISRIPTGATETTVALGNHAHSWSAITNKPSVFAPDTHTHLWTELTDKPTTFAPSAHTHTKSQITDFGHTHLWAELTDKPTTFTPSAHTHLWANITDKPATFTPSAHTHAFADLTSKPTNLSGYGITDALGINSNAVSASKLQTARTIWGVSFDGTNNVAGHLDLITSDLTWGGFANGKTTIKGTTDGLIVYPTGINGTGNIFVNSNGVYHAGNSNKSDVNWTANTLIATTDVTLNALASTDKSVKNFINKFNSMFDTDVNGNIIAKTNLYSVGGISAYQSGVGVSGLKLMGDMNANGKQIDGISFMSGQGLEFSGVYLGHDPEQQRSAVEQGIFSTDNTFTIASWDSVTNKYYYGGGSVNSTPEGLVTAYTGFKFGNYSFKQDGSGRLGIYNGATEIACFNTDGTYVNL